MPFPADPQVSSIAPCADGEVVWSEWGMTATRRTTACARWPVIMFGVRDRQFSWARFYREPVQAGAPPDIPRAVSSY